MPVDPLRVSRIEIMTTLIVLPLVIWLALYFAHRWWSVNLLPALPWVKMLRWIGWAFGVTLLLLSLTGGQLPWVYGIAMTAFSAGLSIPESWIKRRFLSWRNISLRSLTSDATSGPLLLLSLPLTWMDVAQMFIPFLLKRRLCIFDGRLRLLRQFEQRPFLRACNSRLCGWRNFCLEPYLAERTIKLSLWSGSRTQEWRRHGK